jgi:hypothetical protein
MTLTVDIDINEGKMAAPFRRHIEFYVPMDTVQVVKKLPQIA